MYAAGRLIDRVTIYAPTITADAIGAQTTEWTENGTYWATVVPQSGNAVNEYGEVFLSQSLKCYTRWHDGISERCRVEWQGDMYMIKNLYINARDNEITFNLSKIETE